MGAACGAPKSGTAPPAAVMDARAPLASSKDNTHNTTQHHHTTQ